MKRKKVSGFNSIFENESSPFKRLIHKINNVPNIFSGRIPNDAVLERNANVTNAGQFMSIIKTRDGYDILGTTTPIEKLLACPKLEIQSGISTTNAIECGCDFIDEDGLRECEGWAKIKKRKQQQTETREEQRIQTQRAEREEKYRRVQAGEDPYGLDRFL